ncbi:MAG: hypothetical protein KDE56_31690 [Anaerolineales bacterium]|nr:hypothetical protein [Anaerolineales bacterium]
MTCLLPLILLQNVLRMSCLGFLLFLCAACTDTLPVTAVSPTPTAQTVSTIGMKEAVVETAVIVPQPQAKTFPP